MYKVSQTVIDLFNKNYRQIVQISVSGKSGSFTIRESEILQGSLTIDRYSVSGSKIEVGSAVAAELSFNLKNDSGKYDNTIFEGAELYVQIGIKDWTATGSVPTYWIPCGHFIIDEPPRHKSTIKISALDRMMCFDKVVDESKLSFPMTVEDLINRICSLCGVTCVSSLSKLVNKDYSIKEFPSDQAITYRTLLQWCTALTGTCAFMNSDGNLEIKWYESTNVLITSSERYDSDMYENDISITGVYFKDDEEEKEYIAGTDDYCLDLSTNGLIQENPQVVIDTLYVSLKDFSYRPYEATIKPAPYLYPMDRISYKDSKGITHNTIVTNVNFVMNQSTEIAGKGETTQNESYDKNNGLTKQQATILETIRKRVENSLSSREQATLEMNRLLANSLGLYMTGVKQDNGSTKYYFHDGETLETSNIIYTFQANGFAWTKNWNKGEPVWEYGVTKDGNAVLQMLAAYKLTADYIEAGSITADKIATDYKESVTTEIEEKIDDKLVDYSTKTDMESAIKQQADRINMSVYSKVYYNYCTNGSFETDCSGWSGTSFNGTKLENRKIYTYKEKTCAYIGGVELTCPNSASWKFELENDLPIEIALKVALYSLGNKENNSVEIRLDGTAVKTVSRADLSVQWTEIETDVVNMKKGFHTLQIYPTKNSVNGGIYITDIGIYAYRSDQAEAKFSVLSDSISSEITRAKDAEKELSSKITQTALSISTKVEKDGIISAINQTAEAISIKASKIDFNGMITANSYFQIKTDGSFVAKKGTIGDFMIKDGKISTGYATFSTRSHAFIFSKGLEIHPGTSDFSDGSDAFKVYNLTHVTSGGHMVFGNDGVTVCYLSSSSKRYKNHITNMTVEEARKILDIPVIWFKYKDNYLSETDWLNGKKLPGLYAEDVYAALPEAAQINENGEVEDWNFRVIIPAMLKLIQNLYEKEGLNNE